MNQPAFETLHATPPAEPSTETVRVGDWSQPIGPAGTIRAGCREATFFHRAGWKTVIERAFGHKTFFLYAEVDGRIVGVLPLAEIKSLLFGHTLSVVAVLRLWRRCGRGDRARQALDGKPPTLARRLKVGHLEVPQRLAAAHIRTGRTKDLYVTFRKEIDPDEEQNMHRHPAQAARDGAQGDQGRAAKRNRRRTSNASLPPTAASVHRLGTPVFSKKYFRAAQGSIRRRLRSC